jgi:hypothetical protein
VSEQQAGSQISSTGLVTETCLAGHSERYICSGRRKKVQLILITESQYLNSIKSLQTLN